MSIIFGNVISVKPSDAPELASEKMCLLLPKDEVTKLVPSVVQGEYVPHADPEKLKDKFIEIKSDAYTDEQMQAIMNGEFMHKGVLLLKINDYGKTWRAWDGGKPYAEQMAATAWEV